MKAMRFIFVFLVFAGLTSCSSDDDSSNDSGEGDRIVGKWKFQSSTLDGEEVDVTDCEARSTIEFFANGTFSSTDFYEDFDTGACISESVTEKWQNQGNNIYRIFEGNQFTDLKFLFSNNDNTFTILVEEGEGSASITYVRV